MLATEQDAMREFAMNTGFYDRNIGRQWILTDYDVWVRNPHYTGPEQRHPEDDHYDDEPLVSVEASDDPIPF